MVAQKRLYPQLPPGRMNAASASTRMPAGATSRARTVQPPPFWTERKEMYGHGLPRAGSSPTVQPPQYRPDRYRDDWEWGVTFGACTPTTLAKQAVHPCFDEGLARFGRAWPLPDR
jgi:hypothetical protein